MIFPTSCANRKQNKNKHCYEQTICAYNKRIDVIFCVDSVSYIIHIKCISSATQLPFSVDSRVNCLKMKG